MSEEQKIKLFKICTKCSYFCNAIEKDQFCPVCGEKLIIECPQCKKQFDYPYAKFCKYCGTTLKKGIKKEEENKINF